MKVGDLVKMKITVRSPKGTGTGIIVQVDDNHRQTSADVLFCDGLKIRVWEGHIEVISESR